MNIRRRVSGALAVTALALGLVVLPAGGAQGLGLEERGCSGGGIVAGVSTTTYAGTLHNSSNNNCGSVYVQAHYAHVGGTSWTPTASGSYSLYRWANNTYEGKHWAANSPTFYT